MENENMSIKETLHKAYKLGEEGGEKLTTYFFRLRIKWAFDSLKNTDFYNSLNKQDKKYIDDCERYLRMGTY